MQKLPIKYNRRESKVDDKVLEWFILNYKKSVAVEVKIKGNSVLTHQYAALMKVVAGIFGFKIPDLGRRNPFDFFVLKDADAFVCVVDGNDCTCTRLNDGHILKIKLSTVR